MYKMFGRPHLDYCDVIYHIPAITDDFDSSITLSYPMEHLEEVQDQAAALVINGCWQGIPFSGKGGQLIHKNSPSYLCERIPPQRIPIYRHQGTNTFHRIKCRSTLE